MTGHGEVTPLPHIDGSLVLVDDVTYRPKRWSLEIERVTEADPMHLPDGISPLVRDWIAALNRHK